MEDRVTAEIDLGVIRQNVAELRSHVGLRVDVMPVVKANGYGHGALEVARVAQEAGAEWFGVATVEEGVALRKALPRSHIALFAPFAHADAEEIVVNRLTPFVGDLESAQVLSLAAQRLRGAARIHLEIDTGMGRGGLLPENAGRVAGQIARMASIVVTGLNTHFPCAEDDRELTLRQLALFLRAAEAVRATDTVLPHLHCANSAALLQYPSARLNMVRPGLLVYGIVPPVSDGVALPALAPALTLKTRVAQIRSLPAGHTISYGGTHTLTRSSRVASLSVGYGDGYPRALGNRGHVLISGKRAPILGRVCMDVTLVDVTDIPQVQPGSEAVLIGSQGLQRITVEEIARLTDATEHDVVLRLTQRVKRVYRDCRTTTG
jgi:alanine racemase